jgi:hypothetical protein
MAAVSFGEIAPAAGARSLATSYASGNETALHAAIATQINSAITSGLFTCTVACSAYSAQSVENQMNLCSGLGYTVSYSGTTLTLSW